MGVCGVSLLLIDCMATAKKEAWAVANDTVTVFFDNELQEKQIKSHLFLLFLFCVSKKILTFAASYSCHHANGRHVK